MKKVLPNVTVPATSRITATSDGKLAYLCNVKRLSQLFYTGPRYLLSHNTTPANWSTMHESLADGFITKYADPLCLLGVGFGLVTAYIMFDIDRGSPNHPSNDPRAFERFLHTLARIGLNTPVIIRSSHSGGIHVYYFFDRDINTFRIASLSQVTLINAKFEIADGTLELFPNCKPHDNKSNHKLHRSPLQPNNGGAILDRQGNPLICGVNLNHETQLHAYLQMAKNSARNNDIDKIEQQLDPVYAIFKSIPSRYQYIHNKGLSEKAKVWKIDLEVFMGIGWTDYHQTNGLIPRFIAYGIVFMGLEDQKDLFEWVLFAIKNTNGYTQYCRHQHNIEARIWDWIKLTVDKQFYVKYCGYPPRSSDRDNFIALYKNSKSVPTSKADVYQRARVELVASKIQETVEIILATIADIPSRIGDVIQLIQSTAREKFGEAFSRNTLYKLHYKHIWVKLLGTKKVSDIVPTTLVKSTNIEYCPQIVTETAFEESIFCVTDLPKTNLKRIGGETSHSTLSVCSVNGDCSPPPANEADPDLDLELKHITLNPIDSQSALISALPDFDIGHQADPIEPELEEDLFSAPIHSQPSTTPNSVDLGTNPRFSKIEPPGADLITRSAHNYPQSIQPDPTDRDESIQPDPIEPPGVDLTIRSVHNRDKSIEPDPDPKEDLSLDRIDLQSAPTASLPNLDSNSQPDPIELSTADLTSRSYSDQKPTLKYFKSLSLDQKLQLTEQQIQEIRLSRFPLIEKCLVRPFDKYHVHGADRGIVTQIQPWGVYVSWSDGTSGRYACDELICTYSPNLKY